MVGFLKNVGCRCAAIWKAWDQFWFAPLDPSMLGLMRLLTGLMLVYTHFVWGMKLDAFFGTDGFQDPTLVGMQDVEGTLGLSFWWYVPAASTSLVHHTCLALLTMYAFGFCTPITKWTAFAITISYANRALNANFGLDQINGMLSLYLALAPCGATWSVDRWLKLARQRNAAARLGQPYIPAPPPHSSAARMVTRLIQVHMCVLYFFAGISKLKGAAWWTGDSIWMALASGEYQSYDLTWLAWYPWVSYVFTPLTIVWEMTFPIAVWPKALRPWVLLVGVLLHLGIGAFLGMWTFGLIMIVTYLSYFSPEWAQGWRLRRSQPVVSSAPQASAAEHWWAQYRHVTFTAWPFAQLDRIQVERPRVLLVEREDSARTDLQFDLHKAGFACHAVPDVPQACQFLDQYPADALLLVARPSTEVSELLEFRRFLLRMGAAAPVSVTLLPAGHGTEVQATEDHALFRGQPLFEELRRRLLLVLRERAVTDDEALTLTRRAQAQPSPATLVKNS